MSQVELQFDRSRVVPRLQHLKRVRVFGLRRAGRALYLRLLRPVLRREGRKPVLVSCDLRPGRRRDVLVDLLLGRFPLHAAVRLRAGLVLVLAVAVHLDHGALDLAAHVLERVQAGLLGDVHVHRVPDARGLAVQVGPDEEAHKQVRQRQQVHHVEPDGEGLPGRVDALDRAVLEDALRHARLGQLGRRHCVLHVELLTLRGEDVLGDPPNSGSAQGKPLQPGSQAGAGGRRCRDAGLRCRGHGRGRRRCFVRHENGNRVADEQMDGGQCGPDDKLRDLHGRQGALHDGGNADGDRGQRVVRVLELSVRGLPTTMRWIDKPSAHGSPS